ncbi:MAG: indole-3-glycerol phosphate synthase TrpC [Clostridiales Family XIII bacterium]|jgi:indole-3-glycerol phosphate synthase|nr:indole-3-glycerol phosphate synthase TrpC [Clostridiales Family XIII bacterium]
MDILAKLLEATAARLARDKRDLPPAALTARCEALPSPDFAFEKALRAPGISFICEVKKASPSKGLIAADFPYLAIAGDYEAAGAACVSVLTETDYFLGADRYLAEIAQAVSIPALRKDFTVDPYQVYQARALGAKAVLLICRLLEKDALRNLIRLADSLGLSALTEAHDEAELEKALAAGARLVGVNNRDLRTFAVDLQNCVRLRKLAPPEILFVAESGIRERADVVLLEECGVDAVLVGEALMRSPDRQAALRALRGAGE